MAEYDAKFYTEKQLREYEFMQSFSDTYSDLSKKLDLVFAHNNLSEEKSALEAAVSAYNDCQGRLVTEIREYSKYIADGRYKLAFLPDNIKEMLANENCSGEKLLENKNADIILKEISDQCLKDAARVKEISDEKDAAIQSIKSARNAGLIKENEYYEKTLQDEKDRLIRLKEDRKAEYERLTALCSYSRDPQLESQYQELLKDYNNPVFFRVSFKYKDGGLPKDEDEGPGITTTWIDKPGTLEELSNRKTIVGNAIEELREEDQRQAEEIERLYEEHKQLLSNSRDLRGLAANPAKRSPEIEKLIEIAQLKLSHIEDSRAELEQRHSQNRLDLEFLEIAYKIITDLVNQKFIVLNRKKALEDLRNFGEMSESEINQYDEDALLQAHLRRIEEIQSNRQTAEEDIETEYAQKLLPYKQSFEQLLRLKKLLEKMTGSWKELLEKADAIQAAQLLYLNKKELCLQVLSQEKASALIRIEKFEMRAENSGNTEAINRIQTAKETLLCEIEEKISAL